MPTIQGLGEDAFFGFSNSLPQWRGEDATISPEVISMLVGFDVNELDESTDAAGKLVRRARRFSGNPDLVSSFELAAGLPAYMPPDMHGDAWLQAGRVAAGEAIDFRQSADPDLIAKAAELDKLAAGAVRYARKLSPIRRWRDAEGYFRGPNPPKDNCVELEAGPRGGKKWDCNGNGQPAANGEQPAEGEQVQAGMEMGPSPAEEREHAILEAANVKIQEVREMPTPEGIAELADMLTTKLTVAQLIRLKKEHGLRLGGRKSEMALKIAKAATKRITVREFWQREARKVGVRPRDMLLAGKDIRMNYNELTQRVNVLIERAKSLYQHFNGKRLTRAHPAFHGGDMTMVGHFDEISAALASEFPDILSDQGYNPEGMSDVSQPLFDILTAGKQARMSYGESQRQALSLLIDMGMNKGEGEVEEEELVPF